jgi:hypothetical protein
MSATPKVMVNRAPVMTLWATIVAQRLGYDRDTALTLGKTVAGLNAQSKGKRLGIYEEHKEEEQGDKGHDKEHADKEAAPKTVELLGRDIPVTETKQGLRATSKGRAVSPDSVTVYLTQKFGDELEAVEAAMQAVAKSYPKEELEKEAYGLYERFRPVIPEGTKGWGAKGELDVDGIRRLTHD